MHEKCLVTSDIERLNNSERKSRDIRKYVRVIYRIGVRFKNINLNPLNTYKEGLGRV